MINSKNKKEHVSDMLEHSFHNCELVNINEKNFVINELTEQIPATTPSLLKHAAERVIELTDFNGVDKIVGEEEKGAILVAAVSLLTGIPFGLARWYPSGLKGQVEVDFTCEYAEGKIFLNGVNKGDKVIIVDDMISTGGTMIALIDAIHKSGAQIVDIVAVADKEEYGGVQKIKNATGLDAKTAITVSVSGHASSVKNYYE